MVLDKIEVAEGLEQLIVICIGLYVPIGQSLISLILLEGDLFMKDFGGL